mmetsp:Transcript_13284/g.24918  ORF Transcript_13284/g.24918 Transcript_13284/m.24918 type:complete len:278 (-) Transcript_13284:302-1135(-)
MVDEIKAKRERDRDKQTLEKERRIRMLNEERWKLMQREQEVLKEGVVHARIMERGVEFLAGLETGKVSRDDIIKDFGYVETNERQETVEEVIQATRSDLPRLHQRIRALKVEKEATDRVISYIERPYADHEMRRWRQTVPNSTFIAMKDLVYDIVEEVWGKIVERQQEIATIMQHKDYYEKKNTIAVKKLQQQINNKAVIFVAQDLIKTGIEDLLSSVANEVFNIAAFSQDIILDYVSTAISIQKAGGQQENEIRDMLEQMVADPPDIEKHFSSLVN